MSTPGPEVELVSEVPLDAAHWQRRAAAATAAVAAQERVVFARVSVRLLGDDAMARLHERHTGEPGTTDVLAFAGRMPGGAIEVDLAVCPDEAQRRARELGHSGDDELLLYIVHGLLHAAGHEDGDDAGCARMRTAEHAVLTALGAGRVYPDRR